MVAQIDRAYIKARPTRLWSRLVSYGLFEGRPLTTRGRWINPLILAHTKVARVLPALRRVEAPAYILGTGRSGTTILGLVLSMHRAVGFLNEPKLLWAALHDGEDLIGSYNRNQARYRLDGADASPDMAKAAHRVFGSYLALSGTRRLVDKYPELIFRTEFVRAIFPDARFLFLSRSGAATCASIDSWSKRLGTNEDGETHDWWGADDRKWRLLVEQLVPEHADLAAHQDAISALDHTGRAAVEWIVTMREGLGLLDAGDPGVVHVPYERLCAQPRAWAERLQEFLGLERDAVFEAYAAQTLSDPARALSLELPTWLRPIFDKTEAALAQRSEAATV
ncbi:MAG: sulfotransferase [Pseudomonadota bacterium]